MAQSNAQKTNRRPVTYAAAGVDISRADRAKQRIKYLAQKTFTRNVLSDIGSFGGLFSLGQKYKDPVLVSSADGVGTKLKVAFDMNLHQTVGADLVNHCVNDIAVQGAAPLFFLDYFASGKLDPEVTEKVVSGLADACRQNGCALIGGETAEHPGHLGPDDFDLAGAATGVVDEERLLGPKRVRAGDVVIAMASSGLHSNGFSLVRKIIDAAEAGLDLAGRPAELDKPLGVELLTPTRIYARDCLALAERRQVRAFAHVTGGGLAANLARVLPANVDAVLDRGSWQPGPIFGLLAERGRVAAEEMERVFNMGVGMVAIVAATDADSAVRLLAERQLGAWVLGEVTAGTGSVRLDGRHSS